METKITFNNLILAHKELLAHHEELEKCNADLILANKKLNKKQLKEGKQAANLAAVNTKLIIEKLKNEQKGLQLQMDNSKLKNAALLHGENKETLNALMYTLSHKIRKAVANILGISNLLIESDELTPKEFNEMIQIIIQSAQSLNIFTEELSKSIHAKR